MKLKLTILFLLLITSAVIAQQSVDFVTYGAFGDPKEGDDDFKQIFFIKVSKDGSRNFSLEIFDMDCGGKNDVAFGGRYDSEFQFSLYGGKWAYTSPTIKDEIPKVIDIRKGDLINQVSVGEDDYYDDEYITFAEVNKIDGELVDDYYYFKLVVEGISGNDANVFNLRANGFGVEIISYSPTIHLTPDTPPVQLRFFSSDHEKLHIRNYDGDNAKIAFVSPYKEPVLVRSSRNGLWEGDIVYIEPYEQYETCAVQVETVGSADNDLIIVVRDEERMLLPISLPIKAVIPNTRPVVNPKIEYLENCKDVVLSAMESYDPDGDDVTIKWMTETGNIKYGFEEEYSFQTTGKYKMVLAVKDHSEAVESGNYKEFYITINNPPTAKLGKNIIASPGSQIKFDGSASFDSDGEIKEFKWNFGDGNVGSGKMPIHSYSTPGNYLVQLTVYDNSVGGCNTDTASMSVTINDAPTAVAGNDIVCAVNESITLDGSESFDKDGFVRSYEWEFSNKEKTEGAIVQTSFAEPGTYTATLKVKDNTDVENNTSFDQINIKVNSKPVADAGKNKIVAAGDIVKLDASSSIDKDGNISEYTWVLNNQIIDSTAVTNYKFLTPGKYDVKLKVTDNSGTLNNSDETLVTITVNAQPVAKAGEDVFQTNAVVDFDASKSFDSDGEITEYNWDFGDGSSSKESNTTHFYRMPGTYKAILTVKDNSGVTNELDTDTLIVKINSKPIADAGPDLIVAQNEEFMLSADNSIDQDGEIENTIWILNNDTLSNNVQFQHSFSKAGTYSITLFVSDNSHHKEAVGYDQVTVKVNSSPVIITKENYSIAEGEKINFDASNSYDSDGEIESFEWSVNQNGISSQPKGEYTFEKSGSYKLKLEVSDNDKVSNSLSVKYIDVFVNSSPVVQPVEKIVSCNNQIIISAPNAFDSDGDKLSYTWNLGDGTILYGEKITHNYTKSGIYPASLTVNDGRNLTNSKVEEAFEIKINSIPVAVAGDDQVVCTGDIVTLDGSGSFDDDGDLLKYEWIFDDSTTASGISVTKCFNTPGLHTVILKVSDNSGAECSSNIDSKVLTVVESPVAFAGEDITGCANSEVFFDASKSTDSDGIVNSFMWDFGDGTTGGGVTTSHVYKKAGTYNVILTITGELVGECDNTDIDELTVTIIDAPRAEFSSLDSVAVNEIITFDASSSDGKGSLIKSYNWNMGDGTSLKGESITHKYTKAGSYIVELAIDSDSQSECSSSSIKKSIYVNETPVANAGKDLSANVNDAVSFDGSASYDPNGEIVNYIWDFGDGSKTAEGIRISHAYAKPGNYKVTLKVIDETNLSNNFAVDYMDVRINAFPDGRVEVPEYGYVGIPVNIKGINLQDSDGSIVATVWKIGDYVDSTSSSLQYTFKESGTYDVVMQLTDNSGASKQISKSISIRDLPKIKVDYPLTVCVGDAAEFTLDEVDQTSNVNAKWLVKNEVVSEGNNFTINRVTEDLSTVTVRILDVNFPNQILREKVLNVNINHKPSAKIVCEDNIFIGGANDVAFFDASESVDLDGDNLTYTWDFGDGSTSNGVKVGHQYVTSGKYTITLTVNDGSSGGCKEGTAIKIISVNRR